MRVSRYLIYISYIYIYLFIFIEFSHIKKSSPWSQVEKHHPGGKNARRTLHTKRKRYNSGKATSPKKQRKEETETKKDAERGNETNWGVLRRSRRVLIFI